MDESNAQYVDGYDEGYANGRADGYNRAHDVATARAVSRQAIGLPLEYGLPYVVIPTEGDDVPAS